MEKAHRGFYGSLGQAMHLYGPWEVLCSWAILGIRELETKVKNDSQLAPKGFRLRHDTMFQQDLEQQFGGLTSFHGGPRGLETNMKNDS